MENEIIFIGMDFVNEVPRILKTREKKLCKYMTGDEIKAYHFGIDTVMSLFKTIVDNVGPNEVFVHIPNLKNQEEFVLEDLVEKMGNQ